MADPTNGMTSAVAAAIAATPEEDAPVQALLPLLPADEVAMLPLDPVARGAALRGGTRRGPGRPAGAINKKTQDMARMILAKYQSPLVFLAETYSRKVSDLAIELQCKPVEAFQVQLRAAQELAPFLHGKMPVEVNVRGELPMLLLGDPAMFAAQYGIEENQGFNLLDLQPVGQPELDNAAESEDSCGSRDAEPLIADQQGEAGGDADPASEGGS